MDNVAKEIAGVVHGLTTCKTAEDQAKTLKKYFVQDAAFEHPMCSVKSGENSREAILGIYRWYRQRESVSGGPRLLFVAICAD